MGRNDEQDEPTLGEAWTMLGQRLGLSVEVRGPKSIRADGSVRGRPVSVDIVGGEKGAGRKEFFRVLANLNTISSRNRREQWDSVLTVGCANASGLTGTIESSVDANDPAWKPGEYNPRNGRSVRADPPALADRAVTPAVHERLMSILGDVRIEVQPAQIRLEHRNQAIPGKGANYVAGSVIHHYQGKGPAWPERALIGPPWWIDVLCDVAESLER